MDKSINSTGKKANTFASINYNALGNKPMISLPKGKGLRLTIVEELERRKEA